MPTYEYRCDSCSHEFEEFQSITAPPLDQCPKCKGSVRRLISSGNGLIFKGSGFYITDYKKNTTGSDSKEETAKKPEKPETKASDKSTETKKTES